MVVPLSSCIEWEVRELKERNSVLNVWADALYSMNGYRQIFKYRTAFEDGELPTSFTI